MIFHGCGIGIKCYNIALAVYLVSDEAAVIAVEVVGIINYYVVECEVACLACKNKLVVYNREAEINLSAFGILLGVSDKAEDIAVNDPYLVVKNKCNKVSAVLYFKVEDIVSVPFTEREAVVVVNFLRICATVGIVDPLITAIAVGLDGDYIVPVASAECKAFAYNKSADVGAFEFAESRAVYCKSRAGSALCEFEYIFVVVEFNNESISVHVAGVIAAVVLSASD